MNDETFKNFINNDFKKFSSGLFALSAFEFNLLATIIGFAITPTLTTNEQNSLGNFFALVGQVLMTANAQNITLEANRRKCENYNSKLKKEFQTQNTEQEILLIKEEMINFINNFYKN
ncbi:MAG: hypothetical protein R3Y13_01560 [bacterium]